MNKTESDILSELRYRPLTDIDVGKMRSRIRGHILSEVIFRSTKKNMVKQLAEYRKSSKKNSTAYQLIATSKVTLSWGNTKIALPKGDYFFSFYFPEKIQGHYKINYFKKIDMTQVRDTWFIHQLKGLKPKSILELGSGESCRLGEIIRNQFPKAHYLGIDLKAPKKEHYLRANFLVSLPRINRPHVVIAQEVFEHISEKKLILFFLKLKSNGAHTICMTTPNVDFNKYLDIGLRHNDHKFEWSKARLTYWVKTLKTTIPSEVKIIQLGKLIKGSGPTWAINIKFL